MTRTTLWLAASLALLICVVPACSTLAPGVKNQMGTIVAYVEGSPDQVTSAAEKALKEMSLTIDYNSATALDGRILAHTAQGTKVRIDVEQSGENISKTSIRVGSFGDEGVSMAILNRIKENLQ
ncbi:MAG TPA: DUF3568 family protein [Phycisphaeraceae bacterium]